jgi:hypothetical protein
MDLHKIASKVASKTQLVSLKLEQNHHNRQNVAWYAYFTGDCDLDQVQKAFDDPQDKRVERSFLGLEIEDPPDEVPNAFSKKNKLRRFYVGYGS